MKPVKISGIIAFYGPLPCHALVQLAIEVMELICPTLQNRCPNKIYSLYNVSKSLLFQSVKNESSQQLHVASIIKEVFNIN